MLRGMAERNARAQMAQCPGSLAQWAQTQPTLMLHLPQMVLPLRQPPPGWPATLYQQAVQPPKKSTGRGVASNPSTDKTAPTGGASSQDCRRPTTTGQGDGGRSISHPRGIQGNAKVQLPHQEGNMPSRSMPGIPPQRYLKGHSLSGEVGLRPPTVIPLDWQQNFAVLGGRRTLSMCSGSTTNTTLPPLRRQSGRS